MTRELCNAYWYRQYRSGFRPWLLRSESIAASVHYDHTQAYVQLDACHGCQHSACLWLPDASPDLSSSFHVLWFMMSPTSGRRGETNIWRDGGPTAGARGPKLLGRFNGGNAHHSRLYVRQCAPHDHAGAVRLTDSDSGDGDGSRVGASTGSHISSRAAMGERGGPPADRCPHIPSRTRCDTDCLVQVNATNIAARAVHVHVM